MNSIITDFLKENLNWNINLVSKIEPIGGLSNNNYKAIYYNTSIFYKIM